MHVRNSTVRYGLIAVLLHWVIALAIISMWPLGWYMVDLRHEVLQSGDFSRFGELAFLYKMHKSIGLTILALSLLRLLWRVFNPAPPLPEGMAWYEIFASKVSHVAFYGFMIGVPLVGWLMTSAAPGSDSNPNTYFGLFPVPDLAYGPGARDEAVEGTLSEAHELLAIAMLALLVLHVGAALKHHVINRDTVLIRMLPGASLFSDRAHQRLEVNSGPRRERISTID